MITVEDFNSVLKEYGGSNIYHCIDTSLISEDYDYDGIKYDFCEVDRETTDTDEYTFKFKVVNGAWTGGYYIMDSSDEYVDDATVSYDSSTGVITIVTDNPTIKLYLYICNIAFAFEFQKMYWTVIDPHTLITMLGNINGSDAVSYFKLLHNNGLVSKAYISVEGHYESDAMLYPTEDPTEYGVVRAFISNEGLSFNLPYVRVRFGDTKLYFKVEYLYGDPLQIKPSPSNVKVGKINNMEIELDYGKDAGLSFKVYYKDKIIPVVNKIIDMVSRYFFDLDLRDKIDLTPIKLQIKSSTQNYLHDYTYDFSFDCSYLEINTISDLTNECGINGATAVKLNSDLTLTSDLTVTHDLTILGEEHSIDLNGYSFIVNEDCKLEIENCDLSNGDNAIVQKVNSELALDSVSFTNCESSEYSNLGSCIYCDIDLDSLSVEDDFTTILRDCSFFDNQSAILSGGTLVMNGCKLHNTDLDYIDKHNVALLYQTDGNATIRNSIFDIDYTATTLCTNEESIGFAQCLFRLGETARINGHTYTDIRDNGIEITSNACHIFAKYYYPSLEECVFTSPILDKEDSAFCYTLTGLNKVFKHNVQITKASDNTENIYRKIEW